LETSAQLSFPKVPPSPCRNKGCGNAVIPFPKRLLWGSMPLEPAADLQLLAIVRQVAADGTARSIRENARLGLGETARAVGVAKGTLSKWERGLQRPRGAAAARYVALLAELAQIDGAQ
jgi:DNA-binding transcriptional regulator YiaG